MKPADALRRAIPRTLKQPLKRLLGLPQTRLHPDWTILQPIGPNYQPHTVLDIGAHKGWFFHCWLDWCPRAEVHAFEPFPESFETARRLYGDDPRVRLHRVGVGETVGQQTFHVLNASKVSNSFLPPQAETWRRVRYSTGEVSRISVPVTTVDDHAEREQLDRIHLIKIDVQGYELRVLRGAERTLGRVDHILVEAGIQRLYEGAPRFGDVFEFLTARGFHLMAMRAWHRGNHVLMETDMLFRRDDLAPPVDESVVKIMDRVG